MKARLAVWILALATAALLVAGALYLKRPHGGPAPAPDAASPRSAPEPVYVGAAACQECHAQQYRDWQGSHHALAMQPASATTVRGNFDDASATHFGVTTRFFRRDGRYFVHTDGADGALRDFEVRYTFGVYPLQQYLVEFPDGRVQALPYAWDTRPKAQGGERWFHLYPAERLPAGDELHWTGLEQNWNFMCAECHSTDLRKNYDPATNTFHTTWKDIDVACEACHGAGSAHVAWARGAKNARAAADADDGLLAHFHDRRGAQWIADPATGNAHRSRPRTDTFELEACGRCHARAAKLAEDWKPGAPLLDTHRAALLDPGLYSADGQMQGEVYNYGSFLQSRMYAAGVTCGDCHDPHSLKLRVTDGEVCSQCHAPAKYATAAHHHHREDSPESRCPACHMPQRTYMQVHQRHDHSFRIPRPDLSVELTTPNACNDCHTDRNAAWAAARTAAWYGEKSRTGWQRYAGAFTAARRQAATAASDLLQLARDDTNPAIARATALADLGPYLDPAGLEAARGALASPDPLVRLAAVDLLTGTDPATRWSLLAPLLTDPVLAVRSDVASGLADAVPADADGASRAAFEHALGDFLAIQRLNADRPESHLALGNLYAAQGKPAEAEGEFRRALELWPGFVPAYVNLADLARATGKDAEAERWLESARTHAPRNAEVLSALGLLRVRQHRSADALALLARAAELAPDNAHHAYVYAVGLYSSGRRPAALQLLERTHQRFPGNREVLLGLVSLAADSGDVAGATRFAKDYQAIAPSDPRGADLLRQLGVDPAAQ